MGMWRKHTLGVNEMGNLEMYNCVKIKGILGGKKCQLY